MKQPVVLLIEDHPTTRMLARKALLSAGYSVHEARDGDSALALMRAHQPVLVLQDVILPDCDGFELAARLRAVVEGDRVRLLALSGLLSRADATRLWEVGFDDVLMKPLEPARLLACVEYHLDALARDARGDRAAVAQLGTPSVAPGRTAPVVPPREALLQTASASAELSVLSAICAAVLAQADVEGAVVTALSACFDASHCSLGALYLSDRHEQLRMRPLGSLPPADVQSLSAFFGQEDWLRERLREGTPRMLITAESEGAERAILGQARAASAIVAPLVYGSNTLGALFVAMREGSYEAEVDQRWVFVLRVARQVAEALALAHAFREREVAEREAEQQRRLSREQAAAFRSIVEWAPDEIVQLDPSGKVRFANRAAIRARGASGPDESWFDGLSPEFRDRARAAFKSVLSGSELASVEMSRAADDGRMRFTESHLAPLRANGQVAGAVIIHRDISDRKDAEAGRSLDDRMASIGTLAAGVAHEINNPLASVIANLDLAQHEVQTAIARGVPGLSSELIEELKDARAAAERVRSIVRDLRSFSRVDDTRAMVDVESVVEAAVRLAGHELRQRAKLLRKYDRLPPVETNEAMLGQLLLHLIVNAAQALDAGRAESNELRIALTGDGKHVSIALQHVGASAEPRSSYLAAGLSKSRPYGLHEGLARLTCEHLVAALGGELRMNVLPSGGMRVEVSLPISAVDRRGT